MVTQSDGCCYYYYFYTSSAHFFSLYMSNPNFIDPSHTLQAFIAAASLTYWSRVEDITAHYSVPRFIFHYSSTYEVQPKLFLAMILIFFVTIIIMFVSYQHVPNLGSSLFFTLSRLKTCWSSWRIRTNNWLVWGKGSRAFKRTPAIQTQPWPHWRKPYQKR